MSEKRDRSQLSPLQDNKLPKSKSQRLSGPTMGDQAIKEMFQQLAAKMDNMQKSFDEKLQNLVTREDLQI